MIKSKSSTKNPSQSQGQRAVRALAWVLVGNWVDFRFTLEYSVADLALVEVEGKFLAEF